MILIKQHNSHQVAHLYEHLFCMAIDDFFYDNKLFPYLDYDITGHALHGVVYIEIDLYTDEARRLSEQLPGIKIRLDLQTFNVALIQLGSELEQGLGMVGEGSVTKKRVFDELLALEVRAWKGIDEVAVIDPRKTELISGSLYTLKDKKEIPTKKIEISYAIDPNFIETHKELAPLFTNIAKLMSANVTASLYGQLGFYPAGSNYAPEYHATKLIHTFRISEVLEISIEDINQMVKEALMDLYDEKVFSRLVSELNQATSSSHERIFPDPYTIYKRTDIIIGAEGWRRIANDKNAQLLMSHMEVTVAIAEEAALLNVRSVFNI